MLQRAGLAIQTYLQSPPHHLYLRRFVNVDSLDQCGVVPAQFRRHSQVGLMQVQRYIVKELRHKGDQLRL